MALPVPDVHCAIVLRNGTRYVGHVTQAAAEWFRIEEDSRVIDVRRDEVAAVEQFMPTAEMATMCETCRSLVGHADVAP